jgi:hypothetical protein
MQLKVEKGSHLLRILRGFWLSMMIFKGYLVLIKFLVVPGNKNPQGIPCRWMD